MKLENQVVSLDLAKTLKELKVSQHSAFWFEQDKLAGKNEWSKDWKVCFNNGSKPYSDSHVISAFTVAELGEMLPARIEYQRAEHPTYRLAMEKQDTRWNVVYACLDCHGRDFEPVLAPTEANARAKMLVYLLENNLITLP